METLGVSVHWLKHGFLEEVREAGLDERSTIYEIENLKSDKNGLIRNKGQQVVCPIDNHLGSAYVHALGKSKDKVGQSNFMLSYVWGYSIGDIVDALWDHCSLQELDPKRTYVWMCCLCVNQHRVVSNLRSGREVPFRTFHRLFYSRATAIGNILVMMAPWDKPIYISRVWCVFEFFTASTNGHKVTIIMPPKERKNMAALIASKGEKAFLSRLSRTLDNTRVEGAEASYETDKMRILELIQRNTSLDDFNAKVKELLRRCVLDSVFRFAVTLDKVNTIGLRSKQKFMTNVGRIILARGENDDKLEQYTAAITNLEQFGTQNHECRASCHDNIGLMLLKKRDLIGAEDHFNKARSIRSREENPLGRARSNLHFGHLAFHRGELDKAEKLYACALKDIRVLRGKKLDLDIAQIQDSIGLVLAKKNCLKEALKHHVVALEIRKSFLGKDHPDTATSWNNIGVVLYRMQSYEKAKTLHQQALASRESLLGADHVDVAMSQHNLADVLFHSRSDLGRGLQLYRDAYNTRKSSLGAFHPDTDRSFQGIREVANYHDLLGEQSFKRARNDRAKERADRAFSYACENLQKSFDIRSSLLGEEHPDTKRSRRYLQWLANIFAGAGEKRFASKDVSGSIRHHLKALGIRKSLFGREHPATVESSDKLCRVAKSCFDQQFTKLPRSFRKNLLHDKMNGSEGTWSFSGGGLLRGGTSPRCQACWNQIERGESRFLFEPKMLPSIWFYHCDAKCLGEVRESCTRMLLAENYANQVTALPPDIVLPNVAGMDSSGSQQG